MLNAQLSNNTGASCAWNNSSVCSSECSFCCAGCAPLAARMWSRDKKLGERSPAPLIYTAWLYLRKHASLRGVYQKIFLAPQKDDRLAQRPNAIRLERLLAFSRVCPLGHASESQRSRACISVESHGEARDHRWTDLARDLGTETLFPPRRNEYFMSSDTVTVVLARDGQTTAWLLLGSVYSYDPFCPIQ